MSDTRTEVLLLAINTYAVFLACCHIPQAVWLECISVEGTISTDLGYHHASQRNAAKSSWLESTTDAREKQKPTGTAAVLCSPRPFHASLGLKDGPKHPRALSLQQHRTWKVLLQHHSEPPCLWARMREATTRRNLLQDNPLLAPLQSQLFRLRQGTQALPRSHLARGRRTVAHEPGHFWQTLREPL